MGLYATTPLGDSFDTVVTDGLLGTADSLAYRQGEIERHLHSYERWYGASAGPAAPGLETSNLSFRTTSSATANAFGTAVAVFDGTEVLPAGTVYYDPHRIVVMNVQSAAQFRLRFAFSRNGEASYAAAVANGNYSSIVFKINQTNNDYVPILLQSRRMPVGTKIWAAVAKADAGAAWVDFMIGLHCYEG